MQKLSLTLAACVCAAVIGCGGRNSTGKKPEPLALPKESEVSAMTVVIPQNKDLGDFFGGQRYHVLRKDMAGILHYIAPKELCLANDMPFVTHELCPVLCTVEITKSGGSAVRCKVRSTGQNPLVITVDDVTYYWGTSEGEGHDSGYKFIRHIQEINGVDGR